MEYALRPKFYIPSDEWTPLPENGDPGRAVPNVAKLVYGIRTEGIDLRQVLAACFAPFMQYIPRIDNDIDPHTSSMALCFDMAFASDSLHNVVRA